MHRNAGLGGSNTRSATACTARLLEGAGSRVQCPFNQHNSDAAELSPRGAPFAPLAGPGTDSSTGTGQAIMRYYTHRLVEVDLAHCMHASIRELLRQARGW